MIVFLVKCVRSADYFCFARILQELAAKVEQEIEDKDSEVSGSKLAKFGGFGRSGSL